ncbi:unnamed protein product [Clonostachys rosea f. rosea IK726]|uniref:Uncharacterized protein n=2 Tax=Bionectria ochroleuca TaxID=29856 RepID=A0ACA9U7J1_BIOOC|nr:unnamed protein product [Clonostachys rosea f. rosea IK726]
MREKHDLLILTDATASMGGYLRSLNKSLPEIIRISALTGCFERIGVLAYRDYYKGELTEWSGWLGQGYPLEQSDLLAFTTRLRPEHGGDWPEAVKTGLAHAYSVMREDAKTLVLLYADAPPHTPATGGKYRASEIERLKTDAYGTGPEFLDWVSVSKHFRDGPKKATFISVIQSTLADTLSAHLFLNHFTGGTCVEIPDESTPETISSLTINVLLTWMGAEKNGAEKNGAEAASSAKIGSVVNYKDVSTINDVASEEDELSRSYFVKIDNKEYCNYVKSNLIATPLTLENLKNKISRRQENGKDSPPMDFSKRYSADKVYRATVSKQLADIIESNVVSMTVNPVFGTLWRTVCNDRDGEDRDKLIEMFGTQVNNIVLPDLKAKMKAWLESSYDYVGEITALVESVPEKKRFPCVFLDPTVSFTEIDSDGNRVQASLKFTRDELMEIGRSCDGRILSRLGKVMARLTYVLREEDMPEHIKAAPESEVPRIPLVLVSEKYKRQFWKVLLHTVLPGTKLSARPAALLAALSLRMGIKPLEEAADTELLAYPKWNTLDIPETWNTSCLRLLLEADKSYRSRNESTHSSESILKEEDRRLFQSLVNYKMLEMNLNTTLTAKIGWQPSKSKVSLGPVVQCPSCKFPRSVTMMNPSGLCGLCAADYKTEEERKTYINTQVSTHDNQKTTATWVECSMKYCRAQYVVYNARKLNVRPKCWYCRMDGLMPKNHPERDVCTTAPCVECKNCLSRVIWPVQYRPKQFNEAEFKCMACQTERIATIIEVETTPEQLANQEHNGFDWLLRNDDKKIAQPFNNRSLFYAISNAGTEGFADKVEVLPRRTNEDGSMEVPRLTIQGKLVRNAGVIIESLRSWVESRQVESGTCSLCFSNMRKSDLLSACGRRGCGQQICKSCFDGWYGSNSHGQILNLAALSCPFCRRQPSPKVLPKNLRALGNLKTAVEDNGWIYAWCWYCSKASRYMERACGAGAPPPVNEWCCDECMGREPGKKLGIRVKECPGCGVQTEKDGGCDHISCTICDTEWCFFCGEEVPYDIYEHMTERHGGWYGSEEGDDGWE